MGTNLNQPTDQRKHKTPSEGPKRHIVAFVVSLLFTALAFAAVIFAGSSQFIIPFIIVLAIIQAGFQLYIWMHMEQKGHDLPALGMYTGIFVVLTAVVAFTYWLGGY
jgi:cytochrome c oxidase subunit 4